MPDRPPAPTTETASYEVFVGDLRVSIDWQGLTVSVSRIGENVYARTEEVGNGFLLDRNPAGDVVSVEVIAARAEAGT